MANFQKIKEIAKSKGITLAQLATQVGITAPGMTILIRENKSTTDTIEKIARKLQVPVGTFFDEDCLSKSNTLPDEIAIIIEQQRKEIESKDARIKELTDTIIRMSFK